MQTALPLSPQAKFQVQLCAPDEVSTLQRAGALVTWLSSDELATIARVRSAKRQCDWLAGRLAAKRAIISYLIEAYQRSLSPLQIIIDYDGQGRPRPRLRPSAEPQPVDIGHVVEGLSLSLAHSEGWGLAGLAHRSSAGRIGVDLQRIRPVHSRLARRILNADEARHLSECFSGRENEGLLVYWTIKEAALKALGVGLRLHLRAIRVDLSPHPGQAQLQIDLHRSSRCAEARYWAELDGFQAAAALVRGTQLDLGVPGLGLARAKGEDPRCNRQGHHDPEADIK